MSLVRALRRSSVEAWIPGGWTENSPLHNTIQTICPMVPYLQNENNSIKVLCSHLFEITENSKTMEFTMILM